MSTYPIVYDQTPAIDRSRLSVFFRLILIIPHTIVAFFYAIGALVVVFIAWFAILFTGRYPDGMYQFVAGFLRFSMRYNAYAYLITDTFPPFDGAYHPEYPVRVSIPEPQESYDRLTTLFRIVLLIPVLVLTYIFGIWMEAVAIALWFVAVIMGRTPAGLVNAQFFPFAYSARATAYWLLLTDRWPVLED